MKKWTLLLITLGGCGGAAQPDPTDPLATAEHSSTALFASCPGSRAAFGGIVGQGQMLWTPSLAVTANSRVYAKMVGVNGSATANADLWLYQSGVGYVASSTNPATSTEVLDWQAPATTTVWVGAWGTTAGNDTVRVTADVSDITACGPVGSPVDFCFGAVGANCDGVAGLAPCSTRSDALVQCQVSVGAQMHDTCCSAHPGGKNCGGAQNDYSCPTGLCCAQEWTHAQNDTTTTRQFPWVFDATAPTYRPSVMANSFLDALGNYTSSPNGNSIKTPAGKALWDVDAQNGWCTGVSYDRYWSFQGYYAVCR